MVYDEGVFAIMFERSISVGNVRYVFGRQSFDELIKHAHR
jgi:hypothetical protein